MLYQVVSLPQYHAQVIIWVLPAENVGFSFPCPDGCKDKLLYIYIVGVGSYPEDSVLYKRMYREQEAKQKLQPEQVGCHQHLF